MNRMTAFSVIALAGLASCNAYNPDLGDMPFRCAPFDTPRCPDGYDPVSTFNSSGMEISCACTRAAIAIDGGMLPDVAAFVCGEPETTDGYNNSFDTASAIASPPIPLNEKSICPPGDKDYYKINVTSTPTNISAMVVPSEEVEVVLHLYNTLMEEVATSPAGLGEKQVSTSANMVGLYYVLVQTASALVETNYDMTFTVN